MTEIDYKLGVTTQAIAFTEEKDFRSVVYDAKNGRLYSKQSPFQLINELCMRYFITYKARRQCVVHHLGYAYKTPIPISNRDSLHVFPTASPRSRECVWLFLHQIDGVAADAKRTKIIFKNGYELTIDVPKHIIQTQMERLNTCIQLYSGKVKLSFNLSQQPTNSTFYYQSSLPTTPHLTYIAESKESYQKQNSKA